MSEQRQQYIITFATSTYTALEELAEEDHDGDIGEALRSAIALSKWFKEMQKQGKILVEERNGNLLEIVKRSSL